MNSQERAAFDHPIVVEFYKVVAEYRFWVEAGDDSVKIRVRITEDANGSFTYDTSHDIQTPMQDGPYAASRRNASTVEDALEKAIDDLTSFYDSAVENGHAPSRAWFVPSDSFDR